MQLRGKRGGRLLCNGWRSKRSREKRGSHGFTQPVLLAMAFFTTVQTRESRYGQKGANKTQRVGFRNETMKRDEGQRGRRQRRYGDNEGKGCRGKIDQG